MLRKSTMFNISSFLEKFSKNIKSAETSKKQIIEIIEKNTQIKISSEELEIKDYVIYIKSSPAVKNKLFIYKSKILEDISTSISVRIVDIR